MTDSRRGSSSGMMLLANKTVMGSTSRRNSNERIKFSVIDPKMQKAGGNMFVEKEEILEDMLDDEAIEKTRTIRAGLNQKNYENNSNGHQSEFVANKSNEISKQLLKDRLALEAYQSDLAMKKNIQKQIQNTANKKEQVFTNLVSDIGDSMAFLDSIDKNMILMEETKKSKTRRQFEDWNTQVHGGIQMNISTQINQMDSKELNKKKNEDYAKFLEITNRKTAIFRDIIIESEYDPLEPNRRAIKAVTFNLNDPTKIGAQKADEEGSMLGGKKINQKLGKETLNVEQWATGKIEATPYGVGEKMMTGGNKNLPGGGARGGTRGELKSGGRSNIAFDHFTFPTDHDSLDQEMPRGKRIVPTSETNLTANRVFGSAY